MSKKYIVYGEVQGVGFRFYIYNLSKKMKFNGSVKNLSDGSVEVILDCVNHKKVLSEIKKGNLYSCVEKIVDCGELSYSYNEFLIIY